MKCRAKGLSLVEVIVALTIFSILGVTVSALMTSSLGLRRNNQALTDAQVAAQHILELHKNHWKVIENYEFDTSRGTIALIPQPLRSNQSLASIIPHGSSLSLEYGCLRSNGNVITGSGQGLSCSENNPPLRSVRVIIQDSQGIVRANLRTDIGRPIANSNVGGS